MARFGFIHGKLDIKLLILYIMSRVFSPIDFDTLTDLAMCDTGVDYFTYAEAISELLASEHLLQNDHLYSISPKGRRACSDGESSLSSVVRQRCDERLLQLNAKLRRQSQVRTEITPLEAGGVSVSLSMNDEHGSLFSLSLLAPTAEDGQAIADRFDRHPDQIYNGILNILLSDPDRE